jgi:hypothetical protein
MLKAPRPIRELQEGGIQAMTRSAHAFIAAIVLMVGFAAMPVLANETKTGEHFTLSLQGLPDTCPPGETMSASISIFIVDDTKPVKRMVPYTVSVQTPFGNSVIRTGTVLLPAGKTKTLKVAIPVQENAAPGSYELAVSATVDGETLAVHHTVAITKE